LDYRRLVRDSKRVDLSRHGSQVRIALLSDAATQQFVPILRTLIAENGVAPDFYEGPFDAIELEVVNPASGLYEFKPDVVVLVNSTQALRSRYYEHGIEPEIERILRIWDALAANAACRVIQCNFALPYDRPFGQFDLKIQSSLYSKTKALNEHVAVAASERPNVLLCDIEAVASYVGRRNWFDERLWDMSKTFCNLDHLPHAAQAMVDLVLAGLGRVVKCVVLDLDNTLWGGVVGDLGPLGIQVGAHGDGEAFYRFQKYLLALKTRGILLAVCSKNDMANALAPFEQNPEMVLKRDDITVFVANWENKADNIRVICDTLDIGFDSLLFLDDNPFERNLVRKYLPEVIVPELPEDPADFVRSLSELNLFETTSFSAEDVARSALYKQEADRRQTQTRYTDVTEYLKSLDMRITIARFDGAKIGRISQLFLRSNQFNLTTHRYSEGECATMMKNEAGCIPLHASLADRFGDHGLISIVVAWPEGDALRISDWLMSCRVLARGVEQYLMNHMVGIARDRGLSRVSGEYIPSAKNAMVKDFWAQFGFEKTGISQWEIAVAQYEPRTVLIRENIGVNENG
jgi:FkbH-like protein